MFFILFAHYLSEARGIAVQKYTFENDLFVVYTLRRIFGQSKLCLTNWKRFGRVEKALLE